MCCAISLYRTHVKKRPMVISQKCRTMVSNKPLGDVVLLLDGILAPGLPRYSSTMWRRSESVKCFDMITAFFWPLRFRTRQFVKMAVWRLEKRGSGIFSFWFGKQKFYAPQRKIFRSWISENTNHILANSRTKFVRNLLTGILFCASLWK